MGILDFFKKKAPEPEFTTLSDIDLGQMVEVVFHDPRKLGILVPGNTSCTRFNPDEYDNRTVQGFVVHKGEHHGTVFGKYVIIESRKLDKQRQFLLLDYEIDTIRLLT